MEKNIGFISTRFSGTDGVTLESNKWADVLKQNGFRVFWFAGQLNKALDVSYMVPEAYFNHPRNVVINDKVFGRKYRELAVTDEIQNFKHSLKVNIREFLDRFKIDLLIIENALTIPMHIPLGLSLTETIAELQIPTIAHHHDFYWERTRFIINAVQDYIQMAFPPRLPNVEHVVINSEAQQVLAHRLGIASVIIPNVLDFETSPDINPKRSEIFKSSIGLTPGNRMILQPTRIVQRKGIEHAIEFVRELNNPANKLVISHEAGDEGLNYRNWISKTAKTMGVDLRLINTTVEDPWNKAEIEAGKLSLWDVYPHADFITFPSLYEGFGNAFLEAIYFKKPLLINRYATFVRDIEPIGFDFVTMDQFLTKENVEKAKSIMENPSKREEMVEINYQLALRHFSYSVLKKNLHYLLTKFFGLDV